MDGSQSLSVFLCFRVIIQSALWGVSLTQGDLKFQGEDEDLGFFLWDHLQHYLHNGELQIDNNLIENSIRPNALGRKNHLFAGSHTGAQRSAMFYTFTGTCRMHGVEPMASPIITGDLLGNKNTHASLRIDFQDVKDIV